MAAADRLLEFLGRAPQRLLAAAGLLVAAVLAGYAVGFLARGLLRRAGVPAAIEGTAVERTLGEFGTSTVAVLSRLARYFVWVVGLLAILTVVRVRYTAGFWTAAAEYLPQVFVAAAVLLVGVVVGDKVELLIGERLRGLKVPEVGLLAPLAKYTVVYVAGLVALGQLGVATAALLVMLFVYFFGFVVVGTVAFNHLLTSGAAGLYVLLNEPYGIGDKVRIGDRRGVVQEMDVFVTTVETEDGTEYVIPNRKVFTEGVVRLRP